MGSASSLRRRTTVAILSSQTLGAASGLPEAALFSHRSARYGLVSWRCAELRSFLRVSEDLLSPFPSQPVERRLGRAAQPRVFSLLRHRCSQDAAAALLLPLQMFAPGCRDPGGQTGILPHYNANIWGKEAKTRRMTKAPQGDRT